MLDKMDLDRVPDGAETWEKVVRKLRGGMMPPLGAPRPDQASIESLVSFLETSIDRAALAKPNPGRSPLHRLNRSEYANAIRDLLALDIDATAFLPADDEANGFDNIADVLKVSPSLLEQYLTASRKIASLAVGDPNIAPVSAVYRVPPDRAQADHIEGLPLGTRGGIVIHHNFPLDADYDFRVNLLQNIVGYVPGLEWPHTLEITIDGERVFTAPVGGDDDNKLSDTNLALAKDTLDQRLRTRIPVKAGPRVVGVAFIRKNSAESVEPLQPFTRDLDMQNMNGIPLIEHVQIGDRSTRPARATRRAAAGFSCACDKPRGAGAKKRRARKTILSTLARRAYRRPIDTEIDTLLGFYEAGRKKGHLRRRHRERAAVHPDEPEVPVPRRARSGQRRRRRRLSGQRSGARVAAVVLPVEQHPGRSAADRRRRRASSRIRPCSSGRCGGCSPIRDRRRSWTTSPRSGSSSATCRASCRTRRRSRTSTTTCGRRSGARPSCSSRASCARIGTCSIC